MMESFDEMKASYITGRLFFFTFRIRSISLNKRIVN